MDDEICLVGFLHIHLQFSLTNGAINLFIGVFQCVMCIAVVFHDF